MLLIIYIDSLFLTNFFMDTAILFSVYIFKRRRDGVHKILIGAVISAIYGTLMFFPELSFAYGLIGKILVSAIIVFLSFRICGIRDYISAYLMFWLSSAICGGTILAISVLTDFGSVMHTTVSNGVMYIKLNPFLLLFSSIALYFIIGFYRRSFIRNFSKDKIILGLKVLYEQGEYNLNALIDTGCELSDPLTGEPVIVAEKSAFKNISNVIDKICVNTASGKGELQLIFPKTIRCNSQVYKVREKTPIALTDERLSYDGIYNAIINPYAIKETNYSTDCGKIILKSEVK